MVFLEEIEWLGKSPFFPKGLWQHSGFRLTKLHLNKSHTFWNNVCWADETKVETFGLFSENCIMFVVIHSVQFSLNTSYQPSSIMVRADALVMYPGKLAVIEATMNSTLFQALYHILRQIDAICSAA